MARDEMRGAMVEEEKMVEKKMHYIHLAVFPIEGSGRITPDKHLPASKRSPSRWLIAEN